MFNYDVYSELSNSRTCGYSALSREGFTMFNKTDAQFAGSQSLSQFINSVCPTDAHIHVTMRGMWVDGDTVSFRNQSMSSETTRLQVVRAWTCKGITYWTLEKWEHDNGYRCELVVLTKAEFLSLIA
jgi:hypothetical protein